MDPAPCGPVSIRPASLEVVRAGAGEFHHRDLPVTDRIGVWACEVARPAVVLGSRQNTGLIDAAVAAARGIEVVHRRSGGTLVYLRPGEVLWVDVVVPAGHPRLSADLPASMIWMGERWRRALAAVGMGGALEVHAGPLVASAWGDLLCFGSLGPGEVRHEGAKLVGISQRRTRAGARFQIAVHRRFELAGLDGLWTVPTPDAAQFPAVGVLPAAVSAAELLGALLAALDESPEL